MAPEGSTGIQRTLNELKDLEERVRASLRLEIPEVVGDSVLDMLRALKEREVPQVKVVDVPEGIYFLVAAKDWPGLSDASLAVVHDKGYNLSMLFGTQIEGTPYSVVIMKIAETEGKDKREIERDREEMVSRLRTVARGGLDIRTLLGSEARKLRVYNMILEEIERMVEEKRLSKETERKIVGDDGELIKFVNSRTIAYLEERSPRTLAEIVKMQVELAEKARKNPDNVYVDFHIFNVGREGKRDYPMVGFTVVGRSGLVKLGDVLNVFREQDIVAKYRKEFILPDGIAVVRVEIDGSYQNKLMSLREELLNLRNPRPREDDEVAPGEEIFGRMVSDRLVREYESTGIPQLLTMRVSKDIYRASVVGPVLWDNEDEAGEVIEEALRKRRITVQDLTVRFLPRGDKKVGIYIVKLQPNVHMKHVHEKVKEAITEVFGTVRDFDESLRRINYEKLTTLYEMLSENVPRKFIGSIFYSLKDDLRIMEPVEVLAAIISHIFSSVETFLEERNKGGHKKQEREVGMYSTSVSKYEITTVVSRKVIGKEERENLQKRYGKRISRLNIYGNEVSTFMRRKREEKRTGEKEA